MVILRSIKYIHGHNEGTEFTMPISLNTKCFAIWTKQKIIIRQTLNNKVFVLTCLLMNIPSIISRHTYTLYTRIAVLICATMKIKLFCSLTHGHWSWKSNTKQLYVLYVLRLLSLTWNILVSCLYSQLWYSAGVFQALWLVVLVVICADY